MTNSQHTLNQNITTQCPLKTSSKIRGFPIKPLSIRGKINYIGMKYLGKFWLFRYFGAIYPGILDHFSSGRLLSKWFSGQSKSLHEALTIKNQTLYEYCITTGINEFAKKHGGICTFRLGTTPVIYQTSNIPIADDKLLDPSTAQTGRLFGDFIGALPVNSKARKTKRALIESVLGNMTLIRKLENQIKDIIRHLLDQHAQEELCLERFCQEVVADTGSLVPGIFDFQIKPLSHYFEAFQDTTLGFFEGASDFVSSFNTTNTSTFPARLCLFVKTILKDNYSAIDSAKESNIIKRYFKFWNIPFTLESINTLNEDYLRELGTIITNLYESTALSLSWAISHIESSLSIKSSIMQEIQEDTDRVHSYIELVILEAIRLGGTIPTISSRKVAQKFELQVGPNKIIILPGTSLWLNRRDANQDSAVFANPEQFDPDNIQNIINEYKDVQSIVSKKRYEINSFNSMITKDNSRKCPARLYSIYIQSLITHVLYSQYQVDVKNSNLKFNPRSSMPKPLSFGRIQITKGGN